VPQALSVLSRRPGEHQLLGPDGCLEEPGNEHHQHERGNQSHPAPSRSKTPTVRMRRPERPQGREHEPGVDEGRDDQQERSDRDLKMH